MCVCVCVCGYVSVTYVDVPLLPEPAAATTADPMCVVVAGIVIELLCTTVLPLLDTVTTIGLTTAVFRYCGIVCPPTDIGVVTTFSKQKLLNHFIKFVCQFSWKNVFRNEFRKCPKTLNGNALPFQPVGALMQ